MDVGFIAVCDDLSEAIALGKGSVDVVEFYEKGSDVVYYPTADDYVPAD